MPAHASHHRAAALACAALLAAAGATAPRSAQAEDSVAISGGKIKFASEDGAFKMAVGGRIMADYAFYDDDASDLGNGAELRRARLAVSGTIYKNWKFKGQYDFASGDQLRTVSIAYTGFKPVTITVGQFHAPFSLEELTSSKYITFMERALPNVFAPSRQIGAMISSSGDNWTGAFGLFDAGDGALDITTRGTFAPIAGGARHIHLGGAVSWRQFSGADALIRIRQRPESHVTSVRLVDTGSIAGFSRGAVAASDNLNTMLPAISASLDWMLLWGLEAAAGFGPFSVQGEFIQASLSRDSYTDDRGTAAPGDDVSGGGDFDATGFYIQASVFLTPGDRRNYAANTGAFGQVKPKNADYGALEAAIRYSYLDVSDGNVDGGEQSNLTIGLNWHPNPTMRFMANYVQVLEVDGGPNDSDEPAAFQLRAQIEF